MRVVGTVALGAVMVVVAAAFGSPSLYVPGIALILLAVTAGTWVLLAAAGASVERDAGPETVEEEREWPIEVRVRTGLVPAPGGDVREPLLRGALPMAGRASRRVRVSVTFERRGRRVLEPVRLAIRDPLGMLEREFVAGAGQEVLVLPRISPVMAAGGGGSTGGAAAHGSRPAEIAAEVEMESLRPYREGAPASRIHWPTVARSGTLMERRLLADSDTRPLVVLDASRPATAEALDSAVRAAASLAVHLARAGGCSLFLPGDRRPSDLDADLAGWPTLHARLALVEPSMPVPSVRLQTRRGAVYWVSPAPLGRPPRALERAHAQRYLVAPGARTGHEAFTVAGCSGVLLGGGQRRAA